MAVVRLIHWNEDEGLERQQQLEALGIETSFDAGDGMTHIRLARASIPDAIVIDLSRLPSHGRETARTLRITKPTRMVPLVFVDGDPEKVETVRAMLPDATFTTWGRIKTALPKAIAKPPKNPVIPVDAYSSKRAIEKLGIKPGQKVCLLGSPKGFVDTLKPKPAGVTFTAKADASCDLFLGFTRSTRDLQGQLSLLASVVERQTVWLAWQKKASRIKSDVDGNSVRLAGIAAGFVDYKVCAIDETWSGLAFKRRK
jgi:CheY-like chemotaxis protein